MATMNFNTTNSTFRQLLGNGLSYKVPPFQRDYSWTEDEWEDLWQDIQDLDKDDGEPAHYMGYLVLQSSNSKQFDIIDGQQRITTISIIILAGLSYLQDLIAAGLDTEDNTKRREQLQNTYIGYLDPISLVPRSKLELNRHNNAFYQNYMVPLQKLPQRNLNASEHQLRKAFHWFKDQIKPLCGATDNSGKALAIFLEGLVDRLFFTVITVTDELNAFKVFETLNARGVRLSATDLLKNYLFSIISTENTHENEFRALEELWERIVGLLGSESFPEFLRVFWNSRHKLARKLDLFKTIRKKITNRELAFSLLRDLDQSAAIYAALRDPKDNLWNQQESEIVNELLMFNVRQPLSMLMACYEKFYDTQRSAFTQIMRAIVVVSFRYNVICNSLPHEQERLYNDIAVGVSNKNIKKQAEVIQALEAVYPNDNQFKAAFCEKELKTTNSRNRKVVRYILFEIERQCSGKDLDLDSNTYSLEHILPEHPSEAWSYIEESKQDALIYRLGNITLLEKNRNQDLNNQNYETKRTIYQNSIFQITKAIAEHYDSWNEQEIDRRQKQLAIKATGIWNFSFPSQSKKK